MGTEIYDIENWPNFWSYAYNDVETDKKGFFYIHESNNDIHKFYEHFNPGRRYVGFKNVDYDYPVCHFIWKNYKYIKDFDVKDLLRLIRDENDRVIKNEWAQIRDPVHEQCDLYKIHHFDNKNKRTSLKWVQCVLGLENVQTLPFALDHHVTVDDIPLIEEYNLGSDVLSTRKFYEATIPKIRLREQFQEKFGINCLNYSDPKIGSELILKAYCERTGKDPDQVRKLRTYRDCVNLKDILLPIYDFKYKGFQQLLTYLHNRTLYGTKKKDLKENVYFKGITIAYGCGGFHGCCESGVFEENDEYGIYDIDVGSLYPFYNVLNKNYPQHLGPVFSEIMKNLTYDRMAAKKNKDNVTADGLKLALNGTVGNYNQEYSFLYDMQAFLSTTINCQLLVTKLAEDVIDKVPGAKLLQVNTDGITLLIKKEQAEVFRKAYKQWENETGYSLEEATYKKMVIRDVNNYLAIKEDGTTKEKGCFEVEKKVGSEVVYNKNHGKKIVRRALREYYTKGVPIEDYIKSEKKPTDFLIHSKAKRGDRHEYDDQIQQDTLRYYVSKTGKPLFKILKPIEKEGALDKYRKNIPNQLEIFIDNEITHRERRERLSAGYTCKIMNKITDDFDVDYDYYIEEANKIVAKCGK